MIPSARILNGYNELSREAILAKAAQEAFYWIDGLLTNGAPDACVIPVSGLIGMHNTLRFALQVTSNEAPIYRVEQA